MMPTLPQFALPQTPNPAAGALNTNQTGKLPTPDLLRETAEKFEASFLSTYVARMLDSLPTDGPFGGGHAEATFRSFLAGEYAGSMAKAGGIGLADVVYAELVKLQETS